VNSIVIRRRTEGTVLYAAVEEHVQVFFAHVREQGAALPRSCTFVFG